MRIEFVEIANFRKLRSTRVSFAKDKTVFVGANNSGKTSAMVALRYFLVERERKSFNLNDFTVSHWPAIIAMGTSWETAFATGQPLPDPDWQSVLPALDIWLHVEPNEIHYVQKILPKLDWTGGTLGVRLRFEPKDAAELQKQYLTARDEAKAAYQSAAAVVPASANSAAGQATVSLPAITVALWPKDLADFLQRRLNQSFTVKAYILNPDLLADPEHGIAKPQMLAPDATALEDDPFNGLIRINEISAQRGFGSETDGFIDDEDQGSVTATGTRKLSAQLRRYYDRHLNPLDYPDAQDLQALQAIEDAQTAFDARLEDGFKAALQEMEQLGYPGVSDPKLSISTRLRPVEGLNHESAVRYVIQMTNGAVVSDLHLPEDSNGLGYQNLISMVFRLMSFRDAWMLVRKAQSKATASGKASQAPLHLVLIEEPEAHLHTQVQQVFIRQAYKILRNHPELGKKTELNTQLVVSTHSSHIAHECEFSSLRYFRRIAAGNNDIPTSCVVNVASTFGPNEETKRFVTRYLKVTHCDLFFADAAVLIEGPAERILTPYFIREHAEFHFLQECYVTWLEIGGSHAHRLKGLIENLALPTLIITDIDAVGTDGKSARPQRAAGQTSRNQTLKSWHPKTDKIDELLDKTEPDKELYDAARQFSVRVAYQCPVQVSFNGTTEEALAYTLEDALVFANINLFNTVNGTGLLKKFKDAVNNSASVAALGIAIGKSLEVGSKAELALDLLELEEGKSLKPPFYIQEGLLWLREQLRKRQKELGLAIPVPAADQKQAA